jgi:hypothetical protein
MQGKKNLHIKIVAVEANTTFEPKCYLNKSSFNYPTYTNKNIEDFLFQAPIMVYSQAEYFTQSKLISKIDIHLSI